MDRSASMLWIMSGALLLGAVDLFKSVNDYAKGYHVQGLPHRKHTPGVRGLTWEAYVLCWSSFPQ
jgi:hypothetical protein